MKGLRHFAAQCLALLAALCLGAPLSAQVIDSRAPIAVIYDYDTGTVLWSKGGKEPMVPASMTKIMTAYVVFDRLETGELTLDDEFVTSERAWREGGWASGGSTMGLKVGQRANVADLLRGMIIVSGNDACIVLAEGISGTEEAFASEMTRVAQREGFETANFLNSTGLYDPAHVISAEDLAGLSASLIRRFPDYYGLYKEQAFEWNDISQPNRNRLLDNFPGADGIKTGHLSQSGYGMVASAVQDGRRIIVVVNGLSSEAERAQEAERLLRLGFTAFETREVGTPGDTIAEVNVFLGNVPKVGVTLQEPVKITAAKRAFVEGKTEVIYKSPIKAPVKEGQKIAELVITLPGNEPIFAPLYATRDVNKLGFVQRALDGLSQTLFGGSSASK